MFNSFSSGLLRKTINRNFLKVFMACFLCVGITNTLYATPSSIEALNCLQEPQKHALENEKTKLNVTLKHILKSGVENPDSKIGCYAGDAESYTKFYPIFSYVIKNYHKYNPYTQNIGKGLADFCFTNEDLETLSDHVVSTRIRVARNVASFPFPSSMTKDQRKQVERLVLEAIKKLPREYQGKYYSINSLSNEEYESLVDKHLLFKADDQYLKSAGILDDWPVGRGAYISNDKKFMVWINEEDHLRIIYLENGAHIGRVYNKFTQALNSLEDHLTFAHDDKLGYLNSCPTNIGTAMRASVHLAFHALDENEIKELGKKYGLSVRGTHGEHSAVRQGVYDISNSRRLGSTMDDLLSNLVKGIRTLCEKDQQLLEERSVQVSAA